MQQSVGPSERRLFESQEQLKLECPGHVNVAFRCTVGATFFLKASQLRVSHFLEVPLCVQKAHECRCRLRQVCKVPFQQEWAASHHRINQKGTAAKARTHGQEYVQSCSDFPPHARILMPQAQCKLAIYNPTYRPPESRTPA